jgi:gliding motility-associated-like protein
VIPFYNAYVRIIISSLLGLLGCFVVQNAQGQSISNEGTDFYAVFPTHVPAQQQLANYTIFITGKQNSTATVSVGNFSQRVSVTANVVTPVNIPRNAAYISDFEAGTVLSNRAIHVVVDVGQPKVVVYGHIFAGARSAASLILPKEAMGQQYFSFNYVNYPNGGGDNFIIVVATEDNTKVFMRRSGSTILTINLQKAGDVYEYLSNSGDLTGMELVADPATSSCKRFAVFSGVTNVLINTNTCDPQNIQGSDPLYQQNYPVESWGTTYGFVPFSSVSVSGAATRTAGSYYRILAKDNGTQVTINGTTVINLNSGQYYQPLSPSTTPSLIVSNKPIAVAQYALSQTCQGGPGVGDPDMVILNPIEYNIKNITVYSSSEENISEQYINILMKTSGVPSFKINGSAVGGFKALNSTYSYLQLNVNKFGTQNFVLSADEGFNAIAYGFGDHESYAYSAGTNLASSQFITAVKNNRTEEVTNACTKENFEFKLVLPDIANQLNWQFESEPPIIENNPSFTAVTRNGKTLYEYFYPKPQIFQTPGQRSIKVLASFPSANTCYSTEQEINLVFDVYDPPEAKFTAPTSTCPLTAVKFTDQSVSNGKPITKWIWDFGDGTFSSDQNPEHSYSVSGAYNVKLSVDNGTGCASNVFMQSINVRPQPVASFTAPIGNCDNYSLIFTNNSDGSDGTLVRWIWDFDDETVIERTSGEPFEHAFPGYGTYNVKLTVINSNGCESKPLISTVEVFAPSLEVGADRTILVGGGITLDPAVKGNGITYKWSPSIGLSADNIKNPFASPTTDTKYVLTITTQEGCQLTDELTIKVVENFVVPNTFTPNGDGVNDVWNILYLDSYADAEVAIFNRYGEQLFRSVGYANPWDGTYRGGSLPVGTYYYLIRPGHGLRLFSGSVTIIR